jgi:hypothetical protein
MKYFIFVMVVTITITASVTVFSELTKAADAVYFSSLLKDERESVKKGDYLTAIDALNTVLYCEQDSVVSWGFVEVYNGKTDTLYQYACIYNGVPIAKLENVKMRN